MSLVEINKELTEKLEEVKSDKEERKRGDGIEEIVENSLLRTILASNKKEY